MERVLQGRYKIEEPLGVGGSSQVYLARDQALNRDVALKVLDPEAAADGNLRRMFVKEARALAQLSHPNIVAVYDVGEVDDSPFIVMEYLPGGSMKQRIEQAGPLKTGDAVRIAIEVANGLAFAHSKGIIHADLKPANILFDANDAAKICDFGIARNPSPTSTVWVSSFTKASSANRPSRAPTPPSFSGITSSGSPSRRAISGRRFLASSTRSF